MRAATQPGPTPAESLTSIAAAAAQPTSGQELRRRVQYLMLFRLVLISLVLGATIFISALSDVDMAASASLVLFGIIAGTYLATIVYALVLQRGGDPRRLADVQIAVDLLTTALLVHVTGGAQSAYTFFFPLSIIGAATVRFRTGAVAVTAASIALFASVATLGWIEALPAPAGQRILPSDLSSLQLLRALALNVSAFAGVGVLAYNLGGQIQRTSASLESERSAAADLYALHEDIVRSLASGLITVDLADRVLTINLMAGEILGCAPPQAIGRPADGVVPGIRTLITGLDPRESLRRADLDIVTEAGRALALGVSVSPLRNNRDEVIGRVINFQDLTELRKMEQQIKQAERLAVVGTLAAGVAHEIRNPLASISGSIELLRQSPQTDDDNRTLMEIVTREIDRLNLLITDLLDYTNPHPRELVQFDLAELVHETLQVFRQDRTWAGVEVSASRDSSHAGLSLSADPAKLRQVLWNLLRNAAEAATGGGGHVTVRVVGDDDTVDIEITDDGPGIAADNLERVFDPFFTTKSSGSGLGLATCHNIVSEHGGTIEVHSQPGAGTRFVVRLPRGAS